MNYKDVFDRIEAASNYTFNEKQLRFLSEAFSSISEASIKKIVANIECANIPRGVYGFVMGLIKEYREVEYKTMVNRDSWVTQEDCASPEEYSLTMQCIGLISKFEGSSTLLVRFGKYLESAIKDHSLLSALKKAKEFYSEHLKNGDNIKRDLTQIF